ncbi:MAG: hypothetical protein HND55_13070 [Pseudomonadota bacterium]|nr:MAG: hypothetical protein HND55_13070 [Pseudomonadota bacterium]
MRTPILVAALGAVLFFPSARAAEICATSSAGLEFALAAAAGNGESDTIRVTTGTFDTPAGGFEYLAAATENFDLTISGGWSEFFGNDCGQQLEGPPNTVLNGQLTDRILRVDLASSGDFTVSRLRFVNGFAANAARGGAMSVRADTGYSGTVSIERNQFFNNEARLGGAVESVISGTGAVQVHVINNLFRLNRARESGGAVDLSLSGGDAGPFLARLTFVNNTVVDNFSDETGVSQVGGVQLLGDVPARYIVNNNFWGNEGYDFRIFGEPTFVLRNNNYGNAVFGPTSSEGGNISTTPAYEPCDGFLCFSGVPLPDSALHDGGREPAMLSPWTPGAADYRGLPRINEASVDIGAYESHSRLFADRFEP